MATNRVVPIEKFVSGCTTTVEDVINTVYDAMPDFCKDSRLSKQQNVESYWRTNDMMWQTGNYNTYH